MEEPTKKDLEVFMDIFNRLSNFEAMHRHLRGWGEIKEWELPSEEVMKVMAWLGKKVEDEEE